MRYASLALFLIAPALNAQDRPRPRTGGDRPRPAAPATAPAGDLQSRFAATGAQIQAGQYTQALAASEALLRQYPDAALAKFAVGRALVAAQQNPRRAIDLLKQFRAAPPPAGTYTAGAPEWRMGQAYHQLGKNDSAVVLYEMARRLNPVMSQATYSLDSLRRRN